MDANLARKPVVPPDGTVAAVAGSIVDAVATRLLAAWLANRRQTLMPHTLNFRALAASEVALLVATMAFAMQAVGRTGPADRQRTERALELVGADAAEVAALTAALETSQPVALPDEVRAAGIAAHAYACVLLSVDRALPAAQALLGFLAVRLALAPDIARALESRYRA